MIIKTNKKNYSEIVSCKNFMKNLIQDKMTPLVKRNMCIVK